jgi:hypothetical protein
MSSGVANVQLKIIYNKPFQGWYLNDKEYIEGRIIHILANRNFNIEIIKTEIEKRYFRDNG